MNLVLGMMAMDFLLRRIAVVSVLALLPGVSAFPQSDRKDKKQAVSSELRIEVTAGDSGQPVVAAEVLVRYVPEPGSAGKKMEANAWFLHFQRRNDFRRNPYSKVESASARAGPVLFVGDVKTVP